MNNKAPHLSRLHQKKKLPLATTDVKRKSKNRRWALTVVWIGLHLSCHVLGFFRVVVPLLHSQKCLVLLMYSTCIGACVLYMKLAMSAPSRAAVVNNSALPQCSTCQKPKPLRMKHCPHCQMCVAYMDHHCIWVDNCIGQANHRLFCLYLMVHTTHLLTGLLLLFLRLQIVPTVAIVEHWQTIIHSGGSALLTLYGTSVLLVLDLIVLVLVVALCTIYLLILLGEQLYNISRNQLQNEVINGYRYAHFAHGNPFDKGFINNWREFLADRANLDSHCDKDS